MATEQEAGSAARAVAPKSKARWLEVLDALAKLLGAGALIAGAYIANTYQSRMSATTLLSQREMAESQLRASMFNSLIQPVVGSGKDGMIRRDREGLLVELLALNFHEHFEVKPLMEIVDARLSSREPDGMTPDEIKEAHDSLSSVARRVTAQELASVIHEQAPSTPCNSVCTNYVFTIRMPSMEGSGNESEGCQRS